MNANGKGYVVVGIGELLWDVLTDTVRLGGAPANFAVHANALGSKAAIVSAVGSDPDGIEILRQLATKQVNVRHICKTDHQTGKVDVQINCLGQPNYIIRENAAWDFIRMSEDTRTLARTCHAVCFGTLAQRTCVSRTAIYEFLSLTAAHCLRVFDMNLRQQYFSKAILENSLQAANVLKLNEEELAVMQNLLSLPDSTRDALQTLMKRYALNYIALTRGAGGSLLMNKTDIVECPGAALTIQDTIGAGDSFTAAMTLGILYGLPLEAINRIAGKIAAFVCTRVGATPRLPAWLIAAFHKQIPVPIQEVVNSEAVGFQKQVV